jgi:tRNA threonylcarbamoyladenosine biosynthesis protein TsaE
VTRLTHSETETAAVGRELAASLSAGDVIVLAGDLGAGKTAFVRGLAEGLGLDPSDVSSPTFTLVQEYRGGRLLLRHIDLYRLTPREADDLGLEEMTLDGAVLAIEWPDRLPRPFEGAVTVTLVHGTGDTRTITVAASPAG